MKQFTRREMQHEILSGALFFVVCVLIVFVTGVQVGIWWHRTNINAKVGVIGQVAPRP